MRYRAGRLPEAEAGYRQLLADQPNHPGALHFFGILAHQMGRGEAAYLYKRALAREAAYRAMWRDWCASESSIAGETAGR